MVKERIPEGEVATKSNDNFAFPDSALIIYNGDIDKQEDSTSS